MIRCRQRHDRDCCASGFTFIEMLIAASITAMTLAAGATMISAVSNAARDTSETRDVKKAGQMTTDRIGSLIRQARCVGDVTSSAIVLWNVDLNGDEKVNLHETCRIAYDNSTRRISRLQTSSNTPGDVGPEVLDVVFTSNTAMAAMALAYSPREMILADSVADFTMTGYPAKTETRIVNFRFGLVAKSGEFEFRGSASPRASADYLFNVKTNEASETAGMPSQRLEYSRWTGWADVNEQTPTYPGD